MLYVCTHAHISVRIRHFHCCKLGWRQISFCSLYQWDTLGVNGNPFTTELSCIKAHVRINLTVFYRCCRITNLEFIFIPTGSLLTFPSTLKLAYTFCTHLHFRLRGGDSSSSPSGTGDSSTNSLRLEHGLVVVGFVIGFGLVFAVGLVYAKVQRVRRFKLLENISSKP